MRAIPDLLDLPPVWLVLHLLVAALVGHVAALPVPGGVGQWAGAALGL
ncbi:MAG: hypothetical protein HC844_21465, partial [Tabrizicola sp.]|nr:hypothetical protein [Tabrizicola sp.]